MTFGPHGTTPHGATTIAGTGLPPYNGGTVSQKPLLTDPPIFFAVEIDVYQPATAPVAFAFGHATKPHAALSLQGQVFSSQATIYASDVGYVSKAGDAVPLQPYRPALKQAFAINRRVSFNPISDKPSMSFGQLDLSNTDGYYSTLAASTNSDGRGIRVLAGNKKWDASRGIWLDPNYSELRKVFAGIAQPWFCDDTALQIPLSDPTYWLSQPIQSQLYAGTGRLEGGDGLTPTLLNQPNLLGLPKPMTRGGSQQYPVLNVTPVLVDAQNLIYQYTDGPGTVVNLSENGLPGGFTYAGDVSDLYATPAPPSGSYRTCNRLGLFQMGATPGTLTADVTGAYPDGSTPTTAAAMALALLQADSELPGQYINTASFNLADLYFPYQCGYFIGTTPTVATDILGPLLGSIGATLVSRRDGTLGCFALRAIAAGAAPTFSYDPSNAISCAGQSLGAPLDPPPFRWRVGVQKNWTVQTSGLNTTLGVLRKSFLGQEYTTAGWGYTGGGGWVNPTIQNAYRRPSDPAIIPSYITRTSDGTLLAAALGALWGVQPARTLYALDVPFQLGIQHEIGDLIKITWPTRNLVNGAIGQLVGDQVTSDGRNTTITLLVLV